MLTLESMETASKLIAPNLWNLIPHAEYSESETLAINTFINEFKEILSQYPYRMDKYKELQGEQESTISSEAVYCVYCWDSEYGKVVTVHYIATDEEHAMKQAWEYIGNDKALAATNAVRTNQLLHRYNVSLTSNAIWTSFDNIEVTALCEDHAIEKAIEIFRESFKKVNHLLGAEFSISYDTSYIKVDKV